MAEGIRTRATAAEYFDLPETNKPTELINGEIIERPTPVPKHQRAVLDGAILLRGIIPNGKVFIAPLAVYFDDENIPEPDIFWIAADNTRCKVGDKYISGPPGTARRDKTTRFQLYEKYGVREYWMVDPDQQLIEVWKLENTVFVRVGIFGPGETFRSAVLGDKEVNVTGILGSGAGD